LTVANAAILALTISRGAAIALGIAMLYPILRLVFSRDSSIRAPQWLRIGAVGVGVVVVLAVAVPALRSRASAGYYVPGQGTQHDPTSGRAKAWSEFYAIAQQSPLFGHGLGSGPITKIQEKGFLAQHNEYLRLFLEGGYIGGGLVLLAIVIVIVSCITRAPPAVRPDLVGMIAGWAFLSYTDNTLTSVNLTVPIFLLLGICASWSAAPRRWLPTARTLSARGTPTPLASP
jgi:O-antigen ligase